MRLKSAISGATKMALAIICFLLVSLQVRSQFLMDMVDTSKDMGKNMLGIYQKFNYIRLSGYIQPQFQVISEKGAHTYSGPDFPPNENNRFTIRRGRIRVDYAHFNREAKVSFHFAFQMDATERGVNVRDMWGRIFENRWEVFAISTGIFARPFGYEVNLSSSDRESPERGRMSQILMKTERDIGAMLSFEPRRQSNKYKWLKVDAGIFNGQGLTGSGEYDSYKDFITRAAVKPQNIAPNIKMSGGLSLLVGGFMQGGKYSYSMDGKGNGSGFVVDSNSANMGSKVPRDYAGADVQWEFKHPKSKTVLRAEYWQGTQTALANTSETPAVLVTEPLYIRKFNGAFFYLLHQVGKNQFGVKYDWYDPNTKVKGDEIANGSGNFHSADVKYNTLGFGYINYINDNVKLVLWYDLVKNETTKLDGYTKDLRDNILTIRLQFKF